MFRAQIRRDESYVCSIVWKFWIAADYFENISLT